MHAIENRRKIAQVLFFAPARVLLSIGERIAPFHCVDCTENPVIENWVEGYSQAEDDFLGQSTASLLADQQAYKALLDEATLKQS